MGTPLGTNSFKYPKPCFKNPIIVTAMNINKANINEKIISDKMIEKYAPNVVEGVQKLSNWAKNL